ncbi:trypsin-like peptidase domain-containing protein [Candidatus Dojkabacteria bacterium]|nr:trypsin-like peptidase domain-containing protein [Candidatus Dojkabacteria bacterium]
MENKPRGKRLKARVYLGCFLISVFTIISVASAVGVLTYAGYTKKWACTAVIEDSSAWNRIGCEVQDEGDSTSIENYERLQDLLEKGTPEERVTSIVEIASPSVVGIGIEGDTYSSGGILGTGFVIGNGMIATNQHVVSELNAKYFVQVDGIEEVVEVKQIYRDQVNDIAIIEVEQSNNLVPLTLGDSDELKVGQQVIAIGNPLGELSGSVTTGVISGLGRSVDITSGSFFNSALETFDDVIQTDAAINPGNSGGPLLNLKGQVIGINFATVSGADNLSFALPINRIKSRLAELEEYGEFRMPYLGVEYQTRVVFMDNQALSAAQLTRIESGSPAESAGLRVGDFIIGYAGADLGEKNLSSYIQSSEIGEKVVLNVLRDNDSIEIEIEIGVR